MFSILEHFTGSAPPNEKADADPKTGTMVTATGEMFTCNDSDDVAAEADDAETDIETRFHNLELDIRSKRRALMAAESELEDLRRKREDSKDEFVPPDRVGCAFWDRLSLSCALLSRGEYSSPFNWAVVILIITAAVMVGLHTYGINVELLEHTLVILFSLEILVRIIAQGSNPKSFFVMLIPYHEQDPRHKCHFELLYWNIFDLFLVIISMPFLVSTNAMAPRLLRLVRVFEGHGTAVELQMIVGGLVDALKSAVVILFLLVLIFFVFAIAAINFFGENDPWHFPNVLTAVLTLFRVSTLEDWTDIMYINMYGCDKYHSFYVQNTTGHGNGFDKLYACDNPKAQPVLSVLFWIIFVLISAFITLSLFIGAITVSMSGKMDHIKQQRARARVEVQVQKREARKQRKLQLLKSVSPRNLVEAETDAAFPEAKAPTNQRKNCWAACFKDRRGLEHTEKLAQMFAEVFGLNGAELQSNLIQVDHRTGDDGIPCLLRNYISVARPVRKFVDSRYFAYLMTVLILFAAVLVALEVDRVAHSFTRIGDITVLVAFWVELALKIIAEDTRPWVYFYNPETRSWNFWNILDCGVCIGTSIGVRQIMTLRLLRLVRLLKLVNQYPSLSVMASALIQGVTSMWFIGVILALVYYLFGVFATIMFGENDPFHFGNLHTSIVTLFRVATGEDWTDVMYINMYGCNWFGYVDDDEIPTPSDCRNSERMMIGAPLFFVFFYIVGSLVMLNLFVGVITSSMDEANSRLTEHAQLERHIGKFARNNHIKRRMLRDIRRAFAFLDHENNEFVTSEELQDALQVVGCNEEMRLEAMRQLYSQHHLQLDEAATLNELQFVELMFRL